MEDDLETTQQCDPAVSDSDSGGSLFVTQSVSSAERKVQRRCSPRKPSLPYGRNYRDESESEEDGEAEPEPEQGPDPLLLRVSDSDSTVSGLTAIRNKSPSPEPQGDRVRRRPHVYVTPARPRRMKFPFLKSRFERLTVSKNQILVNSEVGGFFKAVKKLGEGHSKKRRELSPTSKQRGRKLENDSMEEDNTDGDEDIRIVDAACFISKKTISKTPRKMNLAEKSKKGQKKENQKKTRKQNEQSSSRPPKGARRLTASRDALSKSHSPGLKVSQRKGVKGETKSRKSARSSTAVSKVIRTLLADLEEHGQKVPEILVTGSQSQPIDDCWPTQDGNSASEMSLGGSDDETMVQETQWPGLTGQSEEGCQSGATEEGEELCVGDGSFHEKDKDHNRSENEDLRLESAPDQTIDRTMVASPLKKSRIVNLNENAVESRYITRSLSQRSCLSTPEKTASLKEDAVSSRASENLIESLKVKYGLYAQIKIPLVDCLAVQPDNAITLSQKEEMQQQTQAEEENVEIESCHVGTTVVNQDFEKETTLEDGQKKERNISDNEEQREDVSRSAELGEIQTTPPSSPIKTTVCLQDSFGVGGSSSDESLHNEDVALDSGHHTSSQDLFEEPNNQADVTVVSSSFIEFITTSDDEDPQENATQCDESKKENGDRRSEILNTEAEYLEQTPECHAPELSENQDTVAHVGGAFVECPSGSNVIGASSPSKDILMDKQGQETQIDAVESPLFNLGGVKHLQRKKRKKVELSQGHNPPQTYQEHLHESFMPSHDVSKHKRSKKDKDKDDERNDTLTLSEEPAGTLPKNGDPVHPVLSDEHSDAPSAGGCGIKTNERDSEDEDTHTPCPASRSLASIAVHLMRPGPSSQQDSGTEIHKEARKELLSDGSETENTRKKKAKKRRLSEVSGFGAIETDVERQKETIIAATGTPSPSLAEPLDNSHILSSTEIQPVMCQSLQAGQDSEAQSTDDCGVKVKKKDKNKESSLTSWAGQDEDPKQNSSTEVHSQESSKDLVQSDGSEPLKKKRRKKAKKKGIPDDTITLHLAEQSQSGNDTTEINDGERPEEEMPSECLVSMTDGSTQLTQSGRFSPQFTSTQVHSEDRKYLDLSDGSSPVKKKTAKKKDSPDDMVTLQSEEQSMSGYGATETNSGEAQGEEIITATEPPSETLAELLMDNCDVPSSMEFQQVTFQNIQAGQDSEAQSTDECGVKAKRKKKKDKHKESSLTLRTDQDEEPQIPSQESSKDLIPSELVKKKKRKKAKDKPVSDDMLTIQSEEQSKSGNDTTEAIDGERREEMPSECLVSMADGSTQLTQSGLFIPHYSSTEASKDLVLSDGSEAGKKKKKKKAKQKDSSGNVVTLESEQQFKSGYGTGETNSGEDQGAEIITATGSPSKTLAEPLKDNCDIPSSIEFQQVMFQDLQAGQDSEAQSTDECWVKGKRKKKKDKHKESFTMKTAQDEDPQMPSPSSECMVSFAGHGKLMRTDTSSQQDCSTEIQSQGSSKDLLIPSVGSEPVKEKKRKKPKKKFISDDMITLKSEEQSKSGNDTTETNTEENQRQKIITEKKKKKKDKHKESSLTIRTDQDEDPQIPSQESSKDLIPFDSSEPVKKKKRKKAKDKPVSDDMVTLQSEEQSKSGNNTTAGNGGERQEEEMPSECLVSMAEGSTQLTQSGPFSPQYSSTQVHTEVSKELVLSDGSEAVKTKKKKKAKEKDSPDNVVTVQFEEQSTNSGEAEEFQFTDNCGVKVKKKKKNANHNESSSTVWTSQHEDPRMSSPSSECQSSMASGPEQLQYNIRTEVHRELKTSDGLQTIKKKKAKKREQSKSGYCITESTAGENEGEEIIPATSPFETNCVISSTIEIQPVMCQALQAGPDSEAQSNEDCGAKMKKKKKKHKHMESSEGQDEDQKLLSSSSEHWSSTISHQDSSTEVHKVLVPCDGSVPIKKTKKKKKYISDDMVTLQHAEKSKSCCDTTAEKTQEEEIITASGELTEDHGIKVKKKKKKDKHDDDNPITDGSEPLKKKKKAKEQQKELVTLEDAEHSESGHGSSKSKFGERPEEDMVSASRVSVEDHGIKGKKKRKKDIMSDLVSRDDGFYQLSGTDPRDNELRQKDSGTEVEKGSKDLGSKPLGKKKRKKMDWSVDMVSVHCAENPEPSCDATKVKTGKKKDRKKELFVEDSSENITPTNHRSENPVSLPASDLVTPRKKKKKWQEQTEQSEVVDTVEQLVTREQQDTEVKKKKKKAKSSYKSVV